MPIRIRTYHDLPPDASDVAEQIERLQSRVDDRLRRIARVAAVMSGKGGVGKSFVTAGLARALAERGLRVGVLDADLNAPSAARFLGVEPAPLTISDEGLEPAVGPGGIALISMALLLAEDQPLTWKEPGEGGFVWRGAQERGALRELIGDVAWGDRDLLLVDLPPGASRLVELSDLVEGLAGVVTVTLPTPASRDSVVRSMELCRARQIPLLGVVENMAGYACPTCGDEAPLFRGDAGAELADRFGIPLLGRIPFSPATAARMEAGGGASAGSPDDTAEIAASAIFRPLADAVWRLLGGETPEREGGAR